MCEKTSTDTQVSEDRREKVFQALERIPLQPVVRQALFPLQSRQVLSRADTPCSPWGTPCQGEGTCPEEAMTLWEGCTGAGSWQDLWLHG